MTSVGGMKRRNGAKWHLGGSEVELAFAEFQHAVICYAESFYRHIGKSLAAIAGEAEWLADGEDARFMSEIALRMQAE